MFTLLSVVASLIVIGVLAGLGHYYLHNANFKAFIDHAEIGVSSALVNFSPLILMFIPFGLDYAEASNIAPFAEEYMKTREETSFLTLLMVLGVSSFMGIILIDRITKIWVKGDHLKGGVLATGHHVKGLNVGVALFCVMVILTVQGYILYIGYTVHVIPHLNEPDDLPFGWARFYTQIMYVAVNISISFFAAYWAYSLQNERETKAEVARLKAGGAPSGRLATPPSTPPATPPLGGSGSPTPPIVPPPAPIPPVAPPLPVVLPTPPTAPVVPPTPPSVP